MESQLYVTKRVNIVFIYPASQKDTRLLTTGPTLANVDQFLKFFHCQINRKILYMPYNC